ncbi:Hsp70 family protein [Actinokineospora xionganensis]|uniref:Hsp70 family protein n=1 Tax=Actinokineospora xionganensis TaxID=2684470 RepID=A0ABR7LG44_9PSEU|nr:Hsp70 family protein [Actinokineospora xionganensis]MBC6451527.1 Hsp70 family protein [Actinokineospora xionganensis]
MPYVLGIDVGRTRGAAAVCRRVGSSFGPPEVVPIDGGNRWTRSMIAISTAGEVLVGQAAEHRAAIEPDRVARDFMARVGDGVPVLLGGELYPAETLAAAVVAWIADVVAQAEGAQPERVAVTHPPDWGSFRRGLLREALAAAGLPGVLLLPTVAAAAEAAHLREPVPAGTALALTLIGGRHCEHAVLYRGQTAFDLVTHVPMVEPDAGDHLDDLLACHVLSAGPEHAADPAAMIEFRLACVAAKERLSVASEVRVPLPYAPGDLTVTRAFFDELARPALTSVVDDLSLITAGVPADQLSGVVLAGGTARVPLLASLATARLDCPVAVEEDPATAACRGAALAARPQLGPARFAGGGHLTADASHPGFRPTGPAGGIVPPGDSSPLAVDGSHPSFRPASGQASDPGFPPARAQSADPAEDVKERAGVRLTEPVLRKRGREEPPPPRPPVEIIALEPPPRRFVMPKRSRRGEDDR